MNTNDNPFIYNKLANGLLLAWYGDDFTGASAVMEVLSFSGVKSMLFLEPPTAQRLARYQDVHAIGVASMARTKSPQWMDEKLPGVFNNLKKLKPAILHYKVCTTLDSSPKVGSIGRAIEIGAKQFGCQVVPILIAAPQMYRYQFFGHLFAGYKDKIYRLDRHPVMSKHPVTPMAESDVGSHIQQQSNKLKMNLLSLDMILDDGIDFKKFQDKDLISAITIDCIDKSMEDKVGKIIWQNRKNSSFIVGSQGVEFALIQHWKTAGYLVDTKVPSGIGYAKAMVTVSGSVSPTTAEQIKWAKQNGFVGISFLATSVCKGEDAINAEINRVVTEALSVIKVKQDPIIYSVEGPDDLHIEQFKNAVKESNLNLSAANELIGQALGKILYQILENSQVNRAVVSGGDTSGHVAKSLGIFALTALAPTIPGASIFKAHTDGKFDNLELALKGGQMGSADYFGWIKNGGGYK